jgi:hypothetical protein
MWCMYAVILFVFKVHTPCSVPIFLEYSVLHETNSTREISAQYTPAPAAVNVV